MAIADLVTRLTLNAKQFVSQFDQAIDQATVRAKSGGRQIGEGLTGEANAKLNEFAGRIPVVGSALGGLSGVALGAAAGIGAVSAALAFGIKEADSYAKEAGKLDAVLKATGNNTGFTADQLRAYAEELETVNAVSAEEFLAAERQLSSFKGIAGSTFKDTIALAADLSATFGGDITSNAEKLGNVLQNLAAGDVDGLSKGFKFLGTETLETVKALAEQGKTLEAQNALIDAVRSRVGGAGAAGGDNLTGDFFRLADAVGDASRAFAEQTGIYKGVRTGINETTTALTAYIDELDRLKSGDYSGIAGATARFIFNNGAFLPDLVPNASSKPRMASAEEFAAAGDRLAGERAARQAADAAKAEGDKRRNAEAAAAAFEKQRTAQLAATRAAEAQANALKKSLGDLKFQAETAGLTRAEVEKASLFRNLELQAGKALTPELRVQADLYFTIAQNAKATRDALADLGSGFAASARAGNDRSLDGLDQAIKDFTKDIAPPDARDPETQRRFEFTSNAFFEILSRGQGSFWDSFQQFGFRTVSNIAAKLAQESGIFDQLGGLGPIGQGLSSGFAGTSLGSSLTQRNTGSAIGGGIGGVAGFAIGGPLGSFVGSFIGSAIGGLVAKRDPFADAFLTTAGGAVTTSRINARGDGRQEQAAGLAGALGQQLQQLASALGGSVANGLNLGTLGSNKDTFFFNPTGGDFRSGGAQKFGSAEQAVEAALRAAISQGAISGIDATVARLLSQGDLQTQVGKAAALAAALKGFDTAANPFAEQVRTLTDEFTQLRDIMAEAGSSTADVAKASSEYDRRLQAIKDSAAQATATLRGFLESLGFGSSSPLSLGDQRSAAQAAFQAQVSRIGGSSFDQSAFTQSGQRLLDIEGQIFGRTDSFFATFNQVQDETRRAIDAIDRAATINGENPFARATASNTQATAENTAAMADALINLPVNLSQQIAAALALLGFSTSGGGRGFVVAV